MEVKTSENSEMGQEDHFLEYTPFVNEECGDTMWDEVLEQDERKNAVHD